MRWILATGLLISGAVFAADGEYKELTAAGGSVNWSTAKVSAEGYGVQPDNANAKVGPLLACRAAVVDAQRNLLEATQGVRVTATTVINNYMLSSDEVKSSVEGVVKNARLLSREPDDEGGCKVVMDIPLGGTASRSIYQHLADEQTTTASINPLQWLLRELIPVAAASTIDNETVSPPWKPEITNISKRLSVVESKLSDTQRVESTEVNEPTGIVVDARGSNFIPSLSPKIRQLRGAVIYPERGIKGSERLLTGGQLVSLFARDVDFAINHPVVGARPLLVKALRTYGDTRTEIVVTEDYASKIAKLNQAGFFDDAGVIIVLD